jgi:hypothetical protein
MGIYDDLRDIQLDLADGSTVIDPATNDAAYVTGLDVILQDAAIRLRTQRGEIKRQGLDTFGWEMYQKIKGDVALRQISANAQEMEKVVLTDERIDDCKVIPGELQADGTIEYVVTISIDNETATATVTL